MQKNTITVIGSYAVGMTIVGEHFPVAGETVSGSDFLMSHGGKGSNQAVAAARMGGDVIYGTCIGMDSFGDMAMKLYRDEKIDATHVRRSTNGLSTGVGLIYVNKHGENEIIIDFAANREFSPEDVDSMLPELKKSKLLLTQLEGSMKTVEYASQVCKRIGIPFVLNPAPYAPMPDILLKNCTFIIPNQTEARLIMGLDSNDPIDDGVLARRIQREKGVENVIITLGSEGAYVQTPEISVRVPGIHVTSVDTTGAGDTFTGAFCVALAEGMSVLEAVKIGNTAAGLAVQKAGVVESIPLREEVENRLSEEYLN